MLRGFTEAKSVEIRGQEGRLCDAGLMVGGRNEGDFRSMGELGSKSEPDS